MAKRQSWDPELIHSGYQSGLWGETEPGEKDQAAGSKHRVPVTLPALSLLPSSLIIYGPAQEEAPGSSNV